VSPIGSIPEAIALLAPVTGKTLHVLCHHQNAFFPTTLTVNKVLAVNPTTRWYPYAAGSFGAELLV
jgi:hypothetical protein